MKSIALILGLFLIIGVMFCPIGCQYALHEGPDWLVTRTSVPDFSAKADEPPFQVSDSAAVKMTTAMLMIFGVIAGISCIYCGTASDK